MNETAASEMTHHAITWLAVVKAVMIIAAGWYAATMANRSFRHLSENKLSVHQISVFGRLIFYGILALFVVTGIHQLGFRLSVLLGAAGIFTVAIGFASQTSASNLISGLFLLGEKPFEVGDVLRVGSDMGEVTSIDLLSVKLRTPDNLFVRIPNETLIKTTVTNLTKYPIRRADLVIGVSYDADLDEVKALLLELCSREVRVLEEPAPFCIVTGFGTSSVDLQLSFWCRRTLLRDMKSDMFTNIKLAFDARGIEIPFPQVSLNTAKGTDPFPISSAIEPSEKH